MKNLKQTLPLIVFVAGSLSGPFASAEKMNAETQNLVIKKMERVLSTMDEKDGAWISSEQRLADLLSERARTRFMAEIEANCDGCKGSKEDRQKAIQIYESLLKSVNVNEHGPILFQLAHLYEMAGQNDKAQQLFESIIKDAKKKKISAEIVTKSHVGLGDLLFQKNKFKDAREHYIVALKDKNLENRSLVIYNKAWCEFNTDQLATAIATLEDLLSHPQQITRDNEDGKVYDPAFHTDLMRDLATFYTRRDITDRDINTYDKLIPQGKRKELLQHFAEEASRLGQKKAAQTILDKYLQDPSLSKEERLQAFVNKAQVSYDRGQSSQSTQDFAKAAAAYQDGGCDNSDKCQELQKTMKHYVTELHRSKKLKPDQDLLNAYVIYTKTFPTDKEMIQRGAQVAMDMNMYPAAVIFYRDISSNRAFSEKEKNEALLNEVAAAEKSNSPSLKKECYIHYIKNSSDEGKKFEVSYQLAYLSYQQKQLNEAAVYFYDLARDKDGKADLRKKAADLSLDSLAQLKDDVTLEKWAWEYAEIFPAQRAEYETLARKSVMNQVAKVANAKNSSASDLKRMLDKTLKTKMSGASNQEKVLYYTNLSVLAQKTDDQETYLGAQQALLNLPGVNAVQKQQITENMAAYYEKHLDFRQAYKLASQVHDTKVSTKDREFRLGTLADLGGINPEKHYRASLRAGLTGSRANVIRSRLVVWSSNPVAELKKQSRELKHQPDLYNDTVLLVYAKTGSKAGLSSFLDSKELRNRSAARFLKSQDIYNRIAQLDRKIAASTLRSKTPSALQKSLAERVKLLGKADAMLNESLKIKDITAQMMTLDIIAGENERIVKELAAVPAPKSLTAAQQTQYMNLLKAKLRPFLYKAKLAQQKRQDIWNHSAALSRLIGDYQNARPEIQRLMVNQMQLLTQVTGEGPLKNQLRQALTTSTISVKDLVSARQSVSENPENIRDIENLKTLETKIGHPLMPAYLEARLNHLEKENRL